MHMMPPAYNPTSHFKFCVLYYGFSLFRNMASTSCAYEVFPFLRSTCVSTNYSQKAHKSSEGSYWTNFVLNAQKMVLQLFIEILENLCVALRVLNIEFFEVIRYIFSVEEILIDTESVKDHVSVVFKVSNDMS